MKQERVNVQSAIKCLQKQMENNQMIEKETKGNLEKEIEELKKQVRHFSLNDISL